MSSQSQNKVSFNEQTSKKKLQRTCNQVRSYMAYSYVLDYKFFNWCMAENVLLQAELGKSFFSGFSVGCCISQEKDYHLPNWAQNNFLTFWLNAPVIIIRVKVWWLEHSVNVLTGAVHFLTGANIDKLFFELKLEPFFSLGVFELQPSRGSRAP